MAFETYMHGFQYLTCGGGRFYIVRSIYFGLIIIGAMSFVVYQTYSNIAAYLRFDVATAISYQHLAYASKQAVVDFPAITICNNNEFLADSVGYSNPYFAAAMAVSEAIQQPLTMNLSNPYDLANLLKYSENALKVCNGNLSAPPPLIANLGGVLGVEYLGVGYMMQAIMPNSVNSILGCKWQGKSINCSDLFLNRFTDLGSCFTFYPSADLINTYKLLTPEMSAEIEEPAFQNLASNCLLPTIDGTNTTFACGVYENITNEAFSMSAFGTTAEQINRYNLSTSSAGAQSGLQLFMNVLPHQYCAARVGAQNTYGFIAFVHDRDVPPILELESGVEIAPGVSINIAIDIKRIDRTATKQIGKCGTAPLEWYPPNTTYSKDACVIQCFGLLVESVCDCITYIAPPMLMSTKKAKTNPCDIEPYQSCYANLIYGYNYSAFSATQRANIPSLCLSSPSLMTPGCLLQMCPNCPYACTETQYTTQASTSPLQSIGAYQALLGKTVTSMTDMTQFRKTFVVANFFYDTLDITLVTETQAIQIMDVVNGIGGSIGLCLGGSFAIIGEILLNAILPLCHATFRKMRNGGRKPNQKTQLVG